MPPRRIADGTINLVAVGNSLTQNGEGALQWPQQLDTMTAANVIVTNRGHGGWTTEPFGASDPNNSLQRVYSLEVLQVLSPTADENILVLWEGRNHMAYGPGARGAADAYWRYVERAIGSGWKVYVGTVIDTNPIGFSNEIRLAFNDLVRAEALANGCRGVIDLAVVPGLDDRNSSLFIGDQIHLTGVGGYAAVAAKVRVDLNLPLA